MKARFVIFRAIIILAFIILTFQLWRLQLIEGEEYRSMAARNRFRLVSTRAPRGVIYDRKGRILVRNIPSFTVSIVPADLPPEMEGQVFARLSALLDLPVSGEDNPRPGIAEMVERGRSTPFSPVPIKRNVTQEAAFIIEEEHLELPGVKVEVEPIRQYTTGPLTAHVIGYVGYIPREWVEDYVKRGYDPNDKVGLTGVELALEDQLHGTKGQKHIEVDAAGREVRTLGYPLEPKPGNNLILTIDLDLQRAVEAALRKGMEGVGSESGVAIAMNPQSGEILALVSLPSYDNNLFASGISPEDYARLSSDPHRPLVNHAISGQYPPGSAIKPMLAAAALEEGVIDRRTKIVCQGTLLLPNKYFPDNPELAQPFRCWIEKYGRGHGPLDVVEAIAHSCDIFFYQVGGGFEDFEGLGLERLAEYARLFGLGEETGIDLAGESVGLVPSKQWKRLNYHESWTTGDTYNVSIGQGFILVTPLQMLNLTAAIANGGTLYRPQIVYQVVDAEGRVMWPFSPQVIRRIPVSEENLAIVREGMQAAVDWGTARRAKLEGVTVAGKTGTAEYPGPRDEEGNLPTHAWFIAFAPVEDPQIALVVFIEGGGSGAEIAVPVAAEILRYYFDLPEPAPTPVG